jgi:prepilin-type N-terminal cleavage/methylation domain-containing protein
MKNKGFTLIELLVVISIISLLSSLVLSALSAAKDKGRIAAGQQFEANIKHGIGDELVGEWLFENNLLDTSGGGNTCDVVGTDPGYSVGILGQARSFNGVGGYYLNCLKGTPLSPDQITVDAWVNIPSGTTGDRAVFSTRKQLFQANSTSTKWWSNTANASQTASVSLSGWKHIAVSSDFLSQKTKMYVDGVLVLDVTDTNPKPLAWTELQIGVYQGTGRYFSGLIDNVRVYTRALTSFEIQKHYAEGLATHPQFANK